MSSRYAVSYPYKIKICYLYIIIIIINHYCYNDTGKCIMFHYAQSLMGAFMSAQ
uniref:Uncharacterized protein n=1 Tax=Anguilla anguilla TaxID=7936 RepID=A0A0E9W5Z3_ANGAN